MAAEEPIGQFIKGCECPNCIRHFRDLADRKMQEAMEHADEYYDKRKGDL
jgi:hypothetical protein